ncbi:hypothetical protein NP233_g11973 [Leucocoprinus birnbaumii]|uniref:Major facilitator superfamily (MFS) profile domain-containing protein n=1 Tax=Leucocoprinus birnbaumii TaxID=56174 RepID=A0AAD5VJ47_9AGAR|nr:hypothetical protein NP233_g11973 [Leucocoprinus birnbaumii]
MPKRTDPNQRDTLVGQESQRYDTLEPTAAIANGDTTADAEEEPRTPLPKFQLFLVLLIQFAEPITAVVIYPFVNQFVRDTGVTQGDDRKTGYYAGVIKTNLAPRALGLDICDAEVRILNDLLADGVVKMHARRFQWQYRCFEDRHGRGTMKFIGLPSESHSRSQLTDSTNVGDAFALMPLMWSAGTTIAPIMGGVLSNPATRWPNIFGKIALFKEHPYFLPCLVAAIVSFFTFIVASLGLKETHPSRLITKKPTDDKERRLASEGLNASPADALLGNSESSDYGTTSSTRCPSPTASETSVDSTQRLASLNPETVTLRSVLASRRMQIIIINYIFLTFTDMCYSALNPLIYSTSVETGGLGLTPFQIGLTMGIWGCCNALVQINGFSRITRKFGAASLYKVAYFCYLMCLMTYPFSTYFARRNGGVGVASCAIIGIQLSFQFFSYMTYGAIHVIIAESTPKPVLGSINGLVQMTGCITRTIAPTLASSLFSLSIQEHILGGYFVYVVIYAIVLVGVRFSREVTDARRKGRADT